MTLDPGGTWNGSPASTPIATSVSWSRDRYISAVLRSDQTPTQKRRLTVMAQHARRDGTVQIGMGRIALASASTFQAEQRFTLVAAGWLEIIDEGDPTKYIAKTYRLTMPTTARVSESTQNTTKTHSGWILRLPLDNDALYQGCHLNAAWVVLSLIREEGAVSLEDLITYSSRSRSQIFKDLAYLKSAGLVHKVVGTYQPIDVTAHEQQKILDRLAQEEGTSGKREAAWQRYRDEIAAFELRRAIWQEEQRAKEEHTRLNSLTEQDLEEGLALLLTQESDEQPTAVAQENEPQEGAETYEEAMARWMRVVDPYDYIRAFHDVLAHPYMGFFDHSEACASMLASIMVTPGAMQTHEARWSSVLGEMIPASQTPAPLLWEMENLYRIYFLFGRTEGKCQRILDKAVEQAEPLTDPRQPSHRDDFTNFPRSVFETPAWAIS